MNNSFVFYKSFYDAMHLLEEHDKCDFIQLICELAFNETEPDFTNTAYSDIVKALYAVTAEQIKASIKHKKAGAKGGTQKGVNYRQNNNFENDSGLNSSLYSSLNTNVNDNDNVNVNVKVNDNEMTSSSSSKNTQDLLINLSSQYGFTINKKSFSKIIGLIESKFINPEMAIKERCEYINAHYSDEPADSKNALFFNSFQWDLTQIQKTSEHKKKLAKTVSVKDVNPPPEKCPICNSKLVRNGMDSVICANCREAGRLVWWEKEHGKWKRQDTETA